MEPKKLLLRAAALWFCGMTTLSPAAPAVIAHRGFSEVAPENTLSAMRAGWACGAQGVELDVHLTADGRVVVIHDEDTSRTAGGVNHLVNATDAATLRRLDVGRWKGAEFAGERVPFLEEVLADLPPGIRVFVEIKSGPETVAPVASIVKKSGKAAQVTVIGFELDTMAAARKALPKVPVYWLRGTEKDKATSKPLPHDPRWIRMAKDRGIDGLDVHFQGLDRPFMDAARTAGLEVHAWTVDKPQEARRLAALGVDSITTNRPDLVMEAVKPARVRPTPGSR
jgi:glycerophosphoryl diester phosphodiesterase